MELAISTDSKSEETLRPENELAQSTNSKGDDKLNTWVLLLPTPLWPGLMTSSTSTYSEEFEEYLKII